MSTARLTMITLTAIAVTACLDLSEYVADPSAGLNGSFETAQSGIPVNWIVYTPATVPDGDFDVLLDELDPKDGDRSLKFDVRACTAIGGNRSPGIAVEIPAEPGQIHQISFWVKSRGARFRATVRGVSAKTGGATDVIADTAETHGDWTLFEHEFRMPEHDSLRFEFSVLAPGQVWIDDVSIRAASEKL